MIDKSLIEERIVALKKQLEAVQANGNALLGAIQFAEELLEADEETPVGVSSEG